MLASAENDPRKAGTIWALNTDEALPQVMPRLKATFSRAGAESAAPLAAAMGANDSDEIRRRFAAGRQCYTAWVGNELASYGWVSLDEEMIGELNLRVRLLFGEAYIWDCATLPEFRGRGLYSALLVHIIRELRSQPVCRAWIGANLDNLASQRGIANAGFHRVADLLVERVLAMRLVWVQGRPGMPENAVNEVRRAFLGNRDRVWLEGLTLARSG